MTEEQPNTNTEPTVSKNAFDWSILFNKHFQQAFQQECDDLPKNSSSQDFQRAATNAFIFTLRESGIKQEDLVEFIGKAIWNPSSPYDEWTEEKNNRRTDLIDKMFQDSITYVERFERGALTQAMRAAVDTEENIPMAGANKLYKKLLEMDDDE